MKLSKRLMTLMLAGMMSFGMVACGGGGSTDDGTSSGGTTSEAPGSSDSGSGSGSGSSNPYKLKVYSFSGGYGEAWINALTERYKKERAGDTIVIDGKTYDGVDFSITKEKQIMTQMMNSGEQYDVWFQEQVYYNQILETGNIFRDMTDVLTEENPYEPGVTIESKMSDYQKEYYLRDGKYYGIPHYAGYIGIAYNKALFEDGGWYFKDGYTAEEFAKLNCFAEDSGDVKSKGPDGLLGTEDDGLPTTYDEFFALCEAISDTCSPIGWAGKYRQEYINWFMTAMTANYEGLEQMSLNYSFDGVAKNLISVDAAGNVTDLPDLTINGPENGYELAKQAGKYYALKFMERILDEGYQTDGSTATMYEQTTAQKDFVWSDGSNDEDFAMLIDGCWWEMEANREFESITQLIGENYRDNFGWLPLPMATQAGADDRAVKLSAGQKGYTLADTHNSLAFIGKQVSNDVYALAKDFLQFANTDESLAEFSMITDTTKALNYTMTPAQKAEMSAYGRSLMTMQENAEIVYTFSKNIFYRANEATFSEHKMSFATNYKENGVDIKIAVDEFVLDKSTEDYFTGLYNYRKKVWNSGVLVK